MAADKKKIKLFQNLLLRTIISTQIDYCKNSIVILFKLDQEVVLN